MFESRAGLLVPVGYGSGTFGPISGTVASSSYGISHLPDINLSYLFRNASYAEMFRSHPAVWTVIDKLSDLTARLPLKVYERGVDGRPEVRDHPYAVLLRNPSQSCDRNEFWRRVSVQYDLYGEAVLFKSRDGDGMPVELVLLHPAAVDVVITDGRCVYVVKLAKSNLTIDPADIVHFKRVDPENPYRGLSPLEPLRRTLDNTEAARAAQASFWRRGARPGVALVHPGSMSVPAAERLRAQFDSLHAGAGNTGSTVVLEEGMKPEVMSLSAEEAQYIQTRKYDDREVFAAYHMPPTAVGDLEYATYANVTENLRSVYRDTVAPRLQTFEATLDFALRPDFGDDIYAEWLMDEVLRGAFEQRAEAYQRADYMTIAEKRRAENLPFIDGTEVLFLNSASLPLETLAPSTGIDPKLAEAVGALIRAGFEPSGALAAFGLPDIPHTTLLPITLQSEKTVEADAAVAEANAAEAVGGMRSIPQNLLATAWREMVRKNTGALERRAAHGDPLTALGMRGEAIVRDAITVALRTLGATDETIGAVAERAWASMEGDLATGKSLSELADEWLATADGWADDVLAELEAE